jgi:hypothetical protein
LPSPLPQIAVDPAVLRCFSGPVSKNINGMILIARDLARARARARAQSEAFSQRR